MDESAAVPARTVELPRPDTSLHDTGPDTEDLARARRQRHLLEHWGFTSHSHLLEIGCGVGRLAYELSGHLADDGRYVGFDVKEQAVEWLNTRYAPHLPNFQFDHFDVANVRYRPDTGAGAGTIRFPYADGEFDFACSFAVFMHMQLPEIANYLNELHRVLRPGAVAVLTATAITKADYERGVMPALGTRPFVQVADGVYAKRPDQPGIGLGYDEALLAAVCEQAGFDLVFSVEGEWHGDPQFRLVPTIGGDVFVLQRPADPPDADRLDAIRRGTTEQLAHVDLTGALDTINEANRASRTDALEESLARLRFRIGSVRRLAAAPISLTLADADAEADAEPWWDDRGVPECDAGAAEVEQVRAALAARSCVILRDALPTAGGQRMLAAFERVFQEVDRQFDDPSYDRAPIVVPLRVGTALGGAGRVFELLQGRVWVVDAPGAMFDVFESLPSTRLHGLATELLGDAPTFPVERLAIQRTPLSVDPMWWQESYVSGLGDLGFHLTIALVDDIPASPCLELAPQPPIPIRRHEHDVAKPPVGVQPDDVPSFVVRPQLRAGDALLTHPSVLRRDEPGTFERRRVSFEALVVAAACPTDAHPVWW
jgi:SAM-dependent methyltransferase